MVVDPGEGLGECRDELGMALERELQRPGTFHCPVLITVSHIAGNLG